MIWIWTNPLRCGDQAYFMIILIVGVSNDSTGVPWWLSGLKKKKKDIWNTVATGDLGLITGSRRSPGGEHGNPFQYSCLENPTDRGDWRATVHWVAKSQTGLKGLSMHTHTLTLMIQQWASLLASVHSPWL